MPDHDWRFCIAAPIRSASGYVITSMPIITWLDKLASNRGMRFGLNTPSEVTGSVPSDNPEVNIPWPNADDDPFVAEGVRTLFGFRRESDTAPYYTVRANGIILDLLDAASSDTARSDFTAIDGWGYLYSRPAVDALGRFPGDMGLNYPNTQGGLIVADLLKNTITHHGECFIDAGFANGGTNFWGGVIQATDVIDYNAAQGTTVGQAWADLADTGTLDIVLTPIYDPINRPGFLWDLSVFKKAGTWRSEAVFAWDMPGRSLTGLDRSRDGRQRMNKIRWHAAQGGPPVGIQTDTDSVEMFGEYWGEEYFPYQVEAAAVLKMAQWRMDLVKNGPEVVTLAPASNWAPDPFTAYEVGDIVSAYASSAFRQQLLEYKRVMEMAISLDDNGVETVTELTVMPGPYPPVVTSLSGTNTRVTVAKGKPITDLTRRRPMQRSWGGRG